ncbi:hypothetical protein E0H77_01580 [Acinetobacter sp. ANC 4633]|uniref:hypothetical protein n=1 Tax=Acinetobacter sp. ANC 4633 TaxID=2529845 RepID=UPI00103A41FE|nr:hypothetical protein [Acinetobacter sp. ANC 4633]TCB28862.1 hypothetical protein E0H77_01580 [Acinetobacter sp. ANC 4633]
MLTPQEIRARDRKRWTIFAIALLIPIALVLLLFIAASQDAKTKAQYDQERAGYAEKYQQQDSNASAAMSSQQQFDKLKQDPEAKTADQH